MSENTIYTSKFETIDAMEEICLKYGFNQSDIAVFLPIFYPVAIVKMLMQERIFEDIDQIPFTLLQLVSLGISDPGKVSSITGLSENYILSALKVMRGVGQIDSDGRLTEYGLASVCEKKNIQLKRVEQSFQIDTLTGGIIKQKQIIKETELYGLGKTNDKMVYAYWLPGVDSEYIREQVLRGDPEQYLEQRGVTLHTNVESIDELEYVETKYARAYVLELEEFKGKPLIFSARMDKTSRDSGEMFSYQPYFAWSKTQINKCGLEEYIQSISKDNDAKEYIKQLMTLVDERLEHFRESESHIVFLKQIITALFPLDFTEEDIVSSGKYLGELYMEPNMIYRCNASFVHLLWLLSRYGAAYISNERTNGRIILIASKNDRINKLVSLYGERCSSAGRKVLKSDILNEFGAYDGADLVGELITYLSSYETKDQM